jgi:uncharacterized pyridoxal phosphate-containing UPF0001 family protein
MARVISGLDVARVRGNVERVRAEIADAARAGGRDPAAVELLAAVKYVPLEELGVLAEAGLTLLGENRAQDLSAKAEAHPGAFRWHFIGQLQSRKVKDILPHAELIHSVASDSALRQLERHGSTDTEVLVEVNVAGGGRQGRRRAGRARRIPRALPRPRLRADDDAAVRRGPEASRPHFAALRELATEHGLRQLSMGTSQDYRVAAEEGATIVRVGSVLYA